MKKRSSTLLLILALAMSMALAAVLTACGASPSSYAPAASSSAASTMRSEDSMDMLGSGSDVSLNPTTGNTSGMNAKASAATAPSPTPDAPPAPQDQPRKLVKHANLALETKEFDNALLSLIQLVEQAGGYLESQSVDGISLRSYGSYYERSAQLTARVPAQKLDEVTGAMGTLCNIVAHAENVSDITARYYDAQSRLDMLTVKEARLTELLAKAEKLEDIIQLESALTECQYEMDSLTGQLRRMDTNVSYSTLNISLNEVVAYSEVQAQPQSFGERLSDSFRRSWRNLISNVEYTILGIVEAGPALIFYLLLWGTLIYLAYRLFLRKRLRARKQARLEKANATTIATATAHTSTVSETPPADKE